MDIPSLRMIALATGSGRRFFYCLQAKKSCVMQQNQTGHAQPSPEQMVEVFNFAETQTEIRTLVIDGNPFISALDVATTLGYANPRDAVKRHCKGVVKHDVLTKGGVQTMNFIPEGDMYRLIIKSELPSAFGIVNYSFLSLHCLLNLLIRDKNSDNFY